MDQAPPLFSIVIPTRDRPAQLAACRESLARLDYPRERFEVIVVDDGGSSPTPAVVESVRDRLDVVLVRQGHGGPAKARNLGATRSRGEILAFTDDDCTPAADWLRALAARFEAASCSTLVGGRTENALTKNSYAAASQLIVDYLYESLNGRTEWFFTSNNFAVPAATFRATGGFDESIPRAAAEDREYCCRWSHLGHPMLFAPEALVHHAHALDFRGFWRQHFNYGRGANLFRRLLIRRRVGHFQLEAFSFYARLLRFPLTRGLNWQFARLSGLLAVSQLAQCSGYAFEGALAMKKGSSDRSARSTQPTLRRGSDKPAQGNALGRAM